MAPGCSTSELVGKLATALRAVVADVLKQSR
jgi:hypothetical protein